MALQCIDRRRISLAVSSEPQTIHAGLTTAENIKRYVDLAVGSICLTRHQVYRVSNMQSAQGSLQRRASDLHKL